MTTIDLDFTGVEAAKPFEALEPGKYTLAIDSAEIKKAKKADAAPNLALVFTVPSEDGAKIWHYLNLGTPSKKYTLQFLLSIFSSVPEGIDLNSDSGRLEFCSALTGMTCDAIVTKRPRTDLPGWYSNGIDCFLPIS